MSTQETVFASTHEREQAGEFAALLRDRLGRDGDPELDLIDIGVNRDFAKFLEKVLAMVAQGRMVKVTSLPRELTTTQAAGLLGISRPTLVKLIADGKLDAHKASTHTRLDTRDVVAFQSARAETQRKALEGLLRIEDEFDLQ